MSEAVSSINISPKYTSKNKQLKACYFNARSIVNKAIYLSDLLSSAEYDIVFIVETWMTSNVQSSLICPPGYDILRVDRTGKKGGGIVTLYKSKYSVINIDIDKSKYTVNNSDNNESTTIESICLDLLPSKSQPRLRFLCVYSPPNLSQRKEYVKVLSDYISVCMTTTNEFYLVGDFNMPTINWKTLKGSKIKENPLIDLCSETGLCQRITETTTKNDSLLDLLFCDDLSFKKILSIDILPPLCSTCDHCMIDFKISVESPSDSCANIPKSFRYTAGDYDSINQSLSIINWNEVFYNCNFKVQDIYDHFLMVMHSLMNEHIPTFTFRRTVKQPRHIKKMAKEKNNLYKKLKQDKSLKTEYQELSKKYDKTVRSWYDSVENKICQNSNSKSFFKYANKKMQSFPSIPPLTSESGDLKLGDKEKADLFNKTFQASFITDNGERLNLTRRVSPNVSLQNIVVNNEILEEALECLQSKTSKTPDEIPSIVIKRTSPALKTFLVMFFNLSLQTSQIPWQWKIGYITPCFKKGNKNIAKNYRPISQTSVLCRLLEKIISLMIIYYLMKNDLLSPNQHGFLPRRSTTSQLLSTLNNWQNCFHSDDTVNVIYTDLAKAFDKVSHPKLLEVIQSYGISGSLYNWITSFLSKRKQVVCVKQCNSELLEVISGVPQGSVIGPLLFLIYIDDVSKISCDQSLVSLFADDAKIYSTEPQGLQNGLDSMCRFFERRQLQLAPEKCEHITISKTNNKTDFYIDNTQVQHSTSVKDLGVTISNDLKWAEHVHNIKSKAIGRCKHILRSFNSHNVWTLLKAYVVYVRPILEYSSVVWNSNWKGDIRSLESVQRYYTKRICRRCNIPNTSYLDRLYKLDIRALEYRRLEFDIVMVYKIIHNLIDLQMDQFFELYTSPYNTRRHGFCLEVKMCSTKHQQGSFAGRVVTIWNKLPASLVDSVSLESFRVNLKKFDLTTITDLVYLHDG